MNEENKKSKKSLFDFLETIRKNKKIQYFFIIVMLILITFMFVFSKDSSKVNNFSKESEYVQTYVNDLENRLSNFCANSCVNE